MASDENGDALAANGPGDPITDVNTLPIVDDATAAKIKAAAGIGSPPPAPAVMSHAFAEVDDRAEGVAAIKPGTERWPVKTGQDTDRALVGKNIINGEDLGAGVVIATVEELISVPRPGDMTDVFTLNPDYQAKRENPAETTIWRLDVTITAMKQESDGDYHLVLQGASGETMIGEVPTPTVEFVGDSPWLANITAARQAVEDKFVSRLNLNEFAMMGRKRVPRASFTGPPPATAAAAGTAAGFTTRLNPTAARITGVGFFDKVHGQMGVSQSNGIELHPILKIEWL